MAKIEVVIEGEPLTKILKGTGETCTIRPFIGFERKLYAGSGKRVPVTFSGIGFDFEHHSFGQVRFLGFPGPFLFLQSLRALKLLELAPLVTRQGALGASWYAATESVAKYRERYLDIFGGLFAGYEDSQKARAHVLALVPHEEEFRKMFGTLEARGASFSEGEILSCLEHRDSAETILSRIRKADASRRFGAQMIRAPAADSFPEAGAFAPG